MAGRARWGGVILTPSKSQLRSSVFASVAPQIADELRKGRQVRTPGGRLIGSETHATIRRNRFGSGAVLALWPSEDILRDLEECYQLDALCVISWIPQHIEAWVSARRAVDLTGSRQRPEEPTISDPVVLAALKSITMEVNMNNRLVDSYGKDSVVGAFSALKNRRHCWNPEEIYVWALANGWPPEAAERLREFAQGVLDGKRYKTGMQMWKDDIVDYWAKEAAASSDDSAGE